MCDPFYHGSKSVEFSGGSGPPAFNEVGTGTDSTQSPDHSLSLNSLLNYIVLARDYQATHSLSGQSENLEGQQSTARHWSELFHYAFSSQAFGSSTGPGDDLLFFVENKSKHKSQTKVQVYRRNSPSMPACDDQSINWEETVYLNSLMQYCSFVLTVAVCTRTGYRELQILRKFSQTVYASPTSHRMDSKGKREEVVYPNVCFTVENYEEIFADCMVRDSESLCIELTAYNLSGHVHSTCFLGSIQYESLKKLNDSKRASHQPGTKFVRMLGPRSKGLAEFAISSQSNGTTLSRRHSKGRTNSFWCLSSPSPILGYHNSRFCGQNDAGSEEEVITRQPINACSYKRPYSDSPHGECNGPDQLLLQTDVDLSGLIPFQPVPSSAKSAGASATCSPIMPRRARRNRLRSVDYGPAEIDWDLYGIGTEAVTHRRPSKVASILNRFVGSNETSSNAMGTIGAIDEESDANEGQCAIESTAHDRGDSFGQSWSWFNERRRVASIPIKAALTFLSLPCRDLLLDLAEVRREPILKVAD